MRVVFANTRDDNTPSGGGRQLYRHVDVLNKIGIDACFAHPTKDFRYTWFSNQTRTVHSDDLELTADDFLVFGEMVSEIPRIKGSDRCAKVVNCQNPFNVLSGFGENVDRTRELYRESAAILCASKHTEEAMKFMASSTPVYRYKYSFDRAPWGYGGNKQNVVCVMPRKRMMDIQAVMMIAKLKWLTPGWNLISLENHSEEQVAYVLKNSSIFMCTSEKEGFGMPPAEAMACGCVVVGYNGFAGSEFMLPGISFPVTDGDFIELTKTLLDVVAIPGEDRLEIGKKASEFIMSSYSTGAEVASIKSAWSKITRPVIDLRTETRERMKSEVAVYMPVYNEGPYMEALLKWLVPRVGTIFVAESIVPWASNGQPGGASEAVVEKVIQDCPEFKEKIVYLQVGKTQDDDEPLIREAKQRNEILAKIKGSGWKYVWMVEADEFYLDEEADNLWAWFFDRANAGARVASSRWHTYWRSVHHRIEPQESFRPNVAFLSDCKFDHGRIMQESDERFSVYVPDRVCMIRHYSWARTPADVKRKLSAWGHAKELIPSWYEKVFLPWKPGSNMTDLHPTSPGSYKSVVKCDLPMPEAMKDHSFLGKDLIEEEEMSQVVSQPSVKSESTKRRIKAVIIHHNKPKNADLLYEQLFSVFDAVEIFDNGSDPNLVPIHVTRSRENVYWTGTWNEVLKTCSDYDAVWVLGCDLTLLDQPKAYREAIESSLPFGCWSPCIQGRAHPFMRASEFADKKPKSVKNIEGMALAMSGELMRKVKELVPGSHIGFGQDFWLCYRARQEGMKNIIDGRVMVHHPEGIGYDEAKAHQQMDEAFGNMYGTDYRKTIFEYDERPVGNEKREASLTDQKTFTIVTVDNGWGLTDFIRVTSKIKDCRRIVMQKGIGGGGIVPGVEFVPYDVSLESLKDADVAFFPRVGAANKDDYLKLLHDGVSVVVKDSCAQGAIIHEKNGWLFQSEEWAFHWLSFLKDNPKERERIRAGAKNHWSKDVTDAVIVQDAVNQCKVTVITPTYRRDLSVVRRCIDCMLLQTEKNWEQIICSDGSKEDRVEGLVKHFNDSRIRYCNTTTKKEGDYGNTVRSEMMKQANGKYILFFDDDNIIMPSYLERMIAEAEKEQADLAICKIIHFGPLNEKVLGKPPMVLTGDPVKLYHIDPLQVLVKRDVMQKVGWDTTVGYLSDGVSLERLNPFKKVRVDEVLGVHM